jgi:hypothetical protein
MTFNFNPEGKFTLLSIDGGGMRGVIALGVLCWLEDQTGKPANELFDMAAGTSTGAIIGTGLGLRMSARRIYEEIYRDLLPKAFGSGRGLLFYLRFLKNKMRFFYPIEPFVKALKPYTNDMKMSEIGRREDGTMETIVLFTVRDLRTSNTYYIVNEGPGANAFAHWTVMGAVASSSAAPIFFPPILGNFIDGGVGLYGNPCFAAAVEAVEYIRIPEDNILHISLGTGLVRRELGEGEGGKLWLKEWIDYIIGESIHDVALDQALNTRSVYRQMDFRRYNPHLTRKVVEEVLGVDTKGRDPLTLSLDSTKPEEIDLLFRIGYAYASKIDWNKQRALPWDTVGGQPKPTIAPITWEGTIYHSE